MGWLLFYLIVKDIRIEFSQPQLTYKDIHESQYLMNKFYGIGRGR
jgi:hypothetical protein